MAGYHGRRAPNVSQYLANLNTVPSPHDIASQQADISIGDDGLDFLTNAEFFDFDALNVDFHGPAGHERPANGTVAQQQYQFQPYPPSMTGSPNSVQSFHGQYAPPSRAAHPVHMPGFPAQQPSGPQVGEKRKATLASLPSATDLEEQARGAAEEDKRRRNTAASARFRVKKKQREAALEKQAKEMTEKVQMLEGKVQQLEMENKWLKGLITDKHDGKTLDEMRRERDAAAIEDAGRSPSDRKDGVGTVASTSSADFEFDDDSVEDA